MWSRLTGAASRADAADHGVPRRSDLPKGLPFCCRVRRIVARAHDGHDLLARRLGEGHGPPHRQHGPGPLHLHPERPGVGRVERCRVGQPAHQAELGHEFGGDPPGHDVHGGGGFPAGPRPRLDCGQVGRPAAEQQQRQARGGRYHRPGAARPRQEGQRPLPQAHEGSKVLHAGRIAHPRNRFAAHLSGPCQVFPDDRQVFRGRLRHFPDCRGSSRPARTKRNADRTVQATGLSWPARGDRSRDRGWMGA